jgi:hypothetical protein
MGLSVEWLVDGQEFPPRRGFEFNFSSFPPRRGAGCTHAGRLNMMTNDDDD